MDEMIRDQGDDKILAVITARGGSKGIPRKNIAPLAGRPLIAWTIDAVRGAEGITRAILSTDDREIADVAKQHGLEALFLRPPELAKDDTPHMDAVVHAVLWMENHENFMANYVLLLQPTLPFRTASDIDHAVRLIREKDGESVVSVCRAFSHPYLTKQMTPDGRLDDFIPPPEGYLARQNLPPVYVLNGAIYLVRRDVLLEKKTFYTDRTYAYVMPPERSLDIDSPWDLYVADLILKDRLKNEHR